MFNHGRSHQPQPVQRKGPPIPRPRKACTICRGLKTRCLPDGENSEPNSQCSRCARLNLPCEYSRAKRGRPQQWNKDRNEQNNIAAGSAAHARKPLPHPAAQGRQVVDGMGMIVDPNQRLPQEWEIVSNGGPSHTRGAPSMAGATTMGMNRPPPHQASILGLNPWTVPPPPSAGWSSSGGGGSSAAGVPASHIIHASPDGLQHPMSVGSLDSVTSPPLGFPPRPRLRPSTTLVDYLEPHLGAEDSRPITPHHGVTESPHTLDTDRGHESTLNFGVVVSPVGSGLVSENEAKYLFQQFLDRVSLTSGLFDPQYHTYARVSGSMPLFTACIYAASRYFRPALSDQLFVLASNNIAKKVQNGDVDVPLIQALLVLVTWKAPSDRTSYIKLGLAVRLMYQLRLEFPTEVVPLTSSDDESRRLVDAERTVCSLIGLDLSYSLMFQLPAGCHPSMLPTEAQLERWAECHKSHKVPGDAFKPFLSSLWEFHEDTGTYPRTNLDLKHAPWTWEAKERRMYEHLDKMRKNPEIQGVLRISGEILGRVQILKIGAIGLLQHANQARGRAAHILSLTEDVSVFIKQLFETGDIIFWSDLWSYALLLPGLLLHCARHLFGPDEVARAKVFCNEMWRVFDQVPREFGDHPLRYIERTYRRLYGAFYRLQKGGEEPQSEEAAIQSILQGQWPALGPVIGGETQDEQPAEWNWLWSSVPLSWSESTNNSSPALK